jgi:hypothetical protein
MDDLTRKFEKEFDELVKAQYLILHSGPHFESSSSFKFAEASMDYLMEGNFKLIQLSQESEAKFNNVLRACEATSLFEKGNAGMDIYNENKKKFVDSCIQALTN